MVSSSFIATVMTDFDVQSVVREIKTRIDMEILVRLHE